MGFKLNPLTGFLDLVNPSAAVATEYTPSNPADWTDPDPTNVAVALDTLAARTFNVYRYKGVWDASTNSPSLSNGTGLTGDVYHVSISGTVNFGAGPITFTAGDNVAYNGSIWERWDLVDAVTSVNGQVGTVVLTKSDVGLSNVDNTSDANKPISTATQTALNLKYDASNPSNYVDASGASAAAPVQSVAGRTGTVVLTKSDVGLSNVDNTSDASKNSATVTLTNKTIDASLNTISNITGTSITNNTITNSKLAQMSANTIKGNNTGVASDSLDLTTTQVKTMLSLSGSNSGDLTLAAVGVSGNANGASLSTQILTLQPASASFPGVLTSSDWSTFNSKQPAGSYITALTSDVSASGPGSAVATVNSVGGSTASAVNSATVLSNNATATNTANQIVKRDANGDFSAGIITASIIGNASGSAGSFTSSLAGDVTGGQTANVVARVGTSLAASVDSATVLVLGSHSQNTFLATPNGSAAAPSFRSIVGADLPLFTDTARGAVGPSGGGTVNFLRADGSFVPPTGADGITALTGDVTATGPGSAAATIVTNAVTNTKLAQMPTNTIKGNNAGGTADAADLTVAQTTAMLNSFTADTFTAAGLKGLVPAPSAATTENGLFLTGNGFVAVDQSKPRIAPFTLWNQTPSTAISNIKFNNVTISGNYAYVSGTAVGTLSIYNISNPARPVLKSTLVTSLLGAVKINVVGNYAYISSTGGSTLFIVNVSDPTNPTITGSIAITGGPGSLYNNVVSGNYCYIATQSKGLTVVDISNPASPTQVFQEGGTEKAYGIGFSTTANTLFVTYFSAGSAPYAFRQFKTWNISTPTAPTISNNYTFAGTSVKSVGLTVSGNYAYVTDSSNNAVLILDVTTPTAPSLLGTMAASAIMLSSYTAQISGNYAYIPSGQNATFGGYIDMYDITNKSSPVKVTSVTSGLANSTFGGIAINGGYIYVGDYGVGLLTSTLDVFTLPNETVVNGSTTTSTLTVKTGATSGYVLTSDAAGKATWQASGTGSAITSLTGDVTGTGPGVTTTTLATVNSNVGSFGSASSVGGFAVNAKGLITAAANTSIQIAESQVTNLVADLAGKQATGNYITDLTGDVTSAGPGSSAATIVTNAVTNTKLAQMATNTIKGNNTGGTANASDLTVAQVNAILPVFTPTLNGLVPFSGGGVTNFLRADGTWTPAGQTVTGDLSQISFSLTNNQAAAANVTGFAFANATVRAFEALVSVFINATTSAYQSFKILGIQKGASWNISVESVGDVSGIVFSITSSGQIQYTSTNNAGFVSGTLKARATVTSV